MFEVPNLLASSRAPASNFFFSIRASCSGDSCPPAELDWVGERGVGEAHGVFLGSGESSSSAARALVCRHDGACSGTRAANIVPFQHTGGFRALGKEGGYLRTVLVVLVFQFPCSFWRHLVQLFPRLCACAPATPCSRVGVLLLEKSTTTNFALCFVSCIRLNADGDRTAGSRGERSVT